MKTKAKDFFDQWWPALLPAYEEEEAKSIIYLLLESYFHTTKTDILVNKEIKVDIPEIMESAIKRLLRHEPIQHILGFAWFMDRQFKVSPDVLIPRQETEELVQLILEENTTSNLKLLDIGTGSGIIPISTALERQSWSISGLDISPQALDIATWNAQAYQTNIQWYQMDILLEGPENMFDIIVSNPPYVLENEKKTMSSNVLKYDPGLALFVSDRDPLIFYEAISHYAANHLSNHGKLYFEINERYGQEVSQVMKKVGFTNVRIHQDLNKKDRFVIGELIT
jgi:release factor glutamine methyltransferase